MELISTHVCKGQNIGVHGNLFGGVMLSWLDEAGAAFTAQVCGTPRMVTKSISGVTFEKPVRPGQIIKIYGDEARRHSVYNGSQKKVCSIDMIFVRIDGDGESVPIRTVMQKYVDRRPEELRKQFSSTAE